MRVVIQRVRNASVSIDQQVKDTIGQGLMILVGFEDADEVTDLTYIVKKILNLRIFDDEAGVMNKSVLDIQGEILLISQFTLHALTAKGNRPSYIKAARPEKAIPLYTETIAMLEHGLGKQIGTGQFGADMQVALINDGPVTIVIDSKIKE